MKKLFLVGIAVMVGTLAYAYDYNYLTFQCNDGTVHSLDVDQLSMTFVEGYVVIDNSVTNERYLLTDLNKMYFTTEPASFANLEAAEGEVEVYATDAVYKGKFSSIEEARQQLERGIYIVKGKNRTFKIVVL